jgi:hypothetical protein
MHYRTLGRTGLKVSEVGFGGAPLGITNYLERWDTKAAQGRRSGIRALRRALELGITYWDTAPGYGDGTSEQLIGEVLPEVRDQVVIATKVGAPWSHESVVASCEASLKRLRVDSIDVFQFHGGHYSDQMADQVLGGGLEAMKKLREDGKIRFIGITAEGSTGALEQIIAGGRLDTLQTRYNFCYQHTCDHVNENAGIIYRAKEHGMGVITMRTLTSGLFQKTMRAAFGDKVEGLDLDGFLLRWVLSNPLVDVALVGMRRPEEAEANAKIADEPGRFDIPGLHYRQVE